MITQNWERFIISNLPTKNIYVQGKIWTGFGRYLFSYCKSRCHILNDSFKHSKLPSKKYICYFLEFKHTGFSNSLIFWVHSVVIYYSGIRFSRSHPVRLQFKRNWFSFFLYINAIKIEIKNKIKSITISDLD